MIWSNEIRKRLHLPDPAPAPEPDTSAPHYHVWAEVSWSGAKSPAYPTFGHASVAVRELARELGAEVIGSDHFPFTQVFLKVPNHAVPADYVTVNVTVDECKPSRQCNRRGVWA